jgi:guanylate cyclase soluble subunit beta
MHTNFVQWPVQSNDLLVALQDIESYTSLSQQCEPEDIMNMLHTLFSVIDAMTTQHGAFKVETIGEST